MSNALNDALNGLLNEVPFADRIREKYPEGLTGIFAIGGTRTTYILEQNRNTNNPGHIKDFAAHGEYLQERYSNFISTFMDLGGQNMIITASSFRGFHERGTEYAQLVAGEIGRMANEQFQAFYAANDIDPYFVGVDIFLHLPEHFPAHQVGRQLIDFQAKWPYKEGRRKLIWEIASIPLFSFWKLFQAMTPEERLELDTQLASLSDMVEIHRVLYKRFSRSIYGADVPMPHFYLGTNKSGDLKWRSPMPISLTGGEYMRLFYTPYPSLFTTRDTLQAILEDMAFKGRFGSFKTDYDGRYTSELVEAEYQRVMQLSAQPETTLGFARKVAEKS
jgi:hypothetical protein